MALKNGFSLIELIVVIGLISLLMLAISSTMLMSMISSNRIRTTSTVKNSGNFALSQLQSMIRNAKSITACDSANSTISYINPDGGSTSILAETVDTFGKIASNSGVYITPSNVSVTSFSLTCEPDDVSPTLVRISFDMQDVISTKRATENPILHFETSVNIRNE